MLMYPRIWYRLFRIVDHRVALIVAIGHVLFKKDSAIGKSSMPVLEKCVDRAGIKNVVEAGNIERCGLEFSVELHFDIFMFQQLFKYACITINRNSLYRIVVVIVVVVKSYRKSFKDRSRQFR